MNFPRPSIFFPKLVFLFLSPPVPLLFLFPPFPFPHFPFSTHSLFIGCLELFTVLSPYSVIGKFKIQLDSFCLLLLVSLTIADINYLLDEGSGYFSISGSHLFTFWRIGIIFSFVVCMFISLDNTIFAWIKCTKWLLHSSSNITVWGFYIWAFNIL